MKKFDKETIMVRSREQRDILKDKREKKIAEQWEKKIKIPENVIEECHQKFMGQKIQFNDRFGSTFIGTCEYLGYNKYFPEWELQITINRIPIGNVDMNSIKLFETK